MSVNKTIKALRIERKLTQNDLAEMMNCNRQKIADWERGKSTPSADDLILLSKNLNVSADYLLGLSDVATTDKDLQFVCDYLGLDENTVKSLKNIDINNSVMIPRRIVNFPSFHGLIDFFRYCNKEYSKFYIDTFNEFLQSNCFIDIVTNCCVDKILEYSLNELINFKNEGKAIEEISEYKRKKIFMFYKIIKDYFMQHDLNVFNTQKSVINFFNNATKLNSVNYDKIESVIKYISLVLYKDDNNTDDEGEEFENTILDCDINDLDSILDFMIDQKLNIEDFIETSKRNGCFSSENEMKEYIVKLRNFIQRKTGDLDHGNS